MFCDVQVMGIDETSLRRGQSHITVVHDLQAKRLLFTTKWHDYQTVLDFAADLQAHGGDPAQFGHVCSGMSAAYAKGAAQTQISYDRFHVVTMAMEASDQVRRAEMTQAGLRCAKRWARQTVRRSSR